MTTAAIFDVIRRTAGSALRGGNLRAFGRYLSGVEGLKRIRTRRGTEYLVTPLNRSDATAGKD